MAVPRRFSLSSSVLLLCAVLCFLSLSLPVDAASGDRWLSRGTDLVVKGDSRWIGMNEGGYFPIRLSIQNSGASRNLTIQFSSPTDYSKMPTVSRSIQVEQNETARFTLLVPIVTLSDYGQFQIFYDGTELKRHTKDFSLPRYNPETSSCPAMLVISSQKVDLTKFETALSSSILKSGSYGGYGGISPDEQHLVIEPTLLPENWLAYSGVDIVSVPLETLTKMRRDARTALLQWVETGGTLIVYNVEQEIETSEQLADALELNGHQHVSQQWINKGIPHRFYFQGMIFSFQKDLSKSTDKDWILLLNTMNKQRYSWGQRHGVSPRTMSNDFLMFRIPGVQGVPIYSFLFLITIFTIVIGPLNYFLLWRRKQLYLLVVTIPVIALVTSLSLFGYSIVAHGWGVKSRVRSVTVLDQQSNTAISTARVALFAGMTPSGGLQFSPNTAVYPLWKSWGEFSNGTVNWSENQSFTTGWLRSRTNTQFLLKEHRTERGRLNIKNSTDGKLNIENGLEWDIEAIIVIDEQGNVFSGEELVAGASTKLHSATEINSFIKLTKQFPLQYPQGVSGGENFNLFRSMRDPHAYRYQHETSNTHFSGSQSEKSIRDINIFNRRLVQGTKQPPENRKTYYAILKQNPGIGIGIEGTDERAGYHLLIGYY